MYKDLSVIIDCGIPLGVMSGATLDSAVGVVAAGGLAFRDKAEVDRVGLYDF